jgi:hypothetical protein
VEKKAPVRASEVKRGETVEMSFDLALVFAVANGDMDLLKNNFFSLFGKKPELEVEAKDKEAISSLGSNLDSLRERRREFSENLDQQEEDIFPFAREVLKNISSDINLNSGSSLKGLIVTAKSLLSHDSSANHPAIAAVLQKESALLGIDLLKARQEVMRVGFLRKNWQAMRTEACSGKYDKVAEDAFLDQAKIPASFLQLEAIVKKKEEWALKRITDFGKAVSVQAKEFSAILDIFPAIIAAGTPSNVVSGQTASAVVDQKDRVVVKTA